jgi:uncharacterized protein involved in exopolysaccharide biosynthesis
MATLSPSSRFKALPPTLLRRRAKYLLLCLTSNALLWAVALVYLMAAPVIYTCEWSLILPGSMSGVNVNLSDLGSISSSATSPFGSGSTIDPRANYKSIAESYTVIAAAAKVVQLNPEQFGKPRIKLVDQTSVMEFSINGKTPKEAQQKSLALYAAFQKRLSQLREDEAHRHQQGFQDAVTTATNKLEKAQKALLRYKRSADIASTSQFQDMAGNIEQLRKQEAEVRAQQQKMASRLNTLSGNIGLTPKQAAEAFALQADALFQQNLKDWSESSAALVLYRSKWGESHPQILREVAKQQSAYAALMERSDLLLGYSVDRATLNRMQLKSDGGNQANLFADLVTTESEVSASAGQAQELAKQIQSLESQQRGLIPRVSTLEGLQRDLQVAEALFSATLGKLDVGKTDVFASYPLVQILLEPGVPDMPSSPKKSFVFLGAGLGSLLVTIGLTLGWMRKKH